MDTPTTPAPPVPKKRNYIKWTVISLLVLVLFVLYSIKLIGLGATYYRQEIDDELIDLRVKVKNQEVMLKYYADSVTAEQNRTLKEEIDTTWKTYTNSQGKFSFKYPSTFAVDSNSPHILKSYENTATLIELGSIVYGPKEDIENYVQNSRVDTSLAANLQLPVGYTSSAYISNLPDQATTIIISNKPGEYDKRVMLWCKGNEGVCLDLLKKILGTFLITE